MYQKQLSLPYVALRGMILFPNNALHFEVGRQQSVTAVEQALQLDQRIFLVAQKNADTDAPDMADLHAVGTIGTVEQVLRLPGDNLRVLIKGTERARLLEVGEGKQKWQAEVEVMPASDEDKNSLEIEALLRKLRTEMSAYERASGKAPAFGMRGVKKITDPQQLVYAVTASLPVDVQEKQKVLEAISLQEQLEVLATLLAREVQMNLLEKMVQFRVKDALDKNQRDYYLREQIKVLQEELGEDAEGEFREFEEALARLTLPDEVREKAQKELQRLERTQQGSPEATVSENYLQWIIDLPWGKFTKDRLSLDRARKMMDADHFGMDKVKERIIEYLAVRAMHIKETGANAPMRGSILCFVGPPGVGKTSIVKSIAKAMDRKFVQMSLGGLRDEAEIFGHRKTYIGAIPGRIITSLKRADSMNPVFLLDEIDKMGHDFRGDPSSAMLEVLDSEQNDHFRDHYLDIPFDLSHVMFVTTANTMSEIPAPLLDRMEIIEVSSYTEEEKREIAKRHLLKRQLVENRLQSGSVKMNDAAFRFVIESYTREAGVRTLSRMLGTIVRKAAVEMLDTGAEVIKVTPAKVEAYLGAPRFTRDAIQKDALAGVVNGLAYTQVGGEMLAVECVTMPGTGKFTLTGQLGDVMKESAQAAFSWVRAHSAELVLSDDLGQKTDIHIHVPEGAVPKDGPSAGVTMATALVSALTQRKVRQDVAMTGEMTLAGRVLPIGGVKEKLLAAFRGGIKVLCLPKENQKDVIELPQYIQDAFAIHYVTDIQQVLDVTLMEA